MKAKTMVALGGAAAATAGALGYWLKVRPWHLRWGATPEEVERRLPGDERVKEPDLDSTHAITIHAPADEIWPWLIQMGQGRGGFYSYTWLENLVGCRMRNADRIRPELQHLAVGDRIYLHPKAPPLTVEILVPGRALVLSETWGFYLDPIDARSTRLIVRGRGRFSAQPFPEGRLLRFLVWRLIFEPAHFIMERRMLYGIKERAERARRPRRLATAA
ncbi:MAG TPA: hypothetical protein VMM92_00950 [Thermoanaerobaculia bacterium]|nr:hypothetical protein [Thermoanaerobaculia bacterium]